MKCLLSFFSDDDDRPSGPNAIITEGWIDFILRYYLKETLLFALTDFPIRKDEVYPKFSNRLTYFGGIVNMSQQVCFF